MTMMMMRTTLVSMCCERKRRRGFKNVRRKNCYFPADRCKFSTEHAGAPNFKCL